MTTVEVDTRLVAAQTAVDRTFKRRWLLTKLPSEDVDPKIKIVEKIVRVGLPDEVAVEEEVTGRGFFVDRTQKLILAALRLHHDPYQVTYHQLFIPEEGKNDFSFDRYMPPVIEWLYENYGEHYRGHSVDEAYQNYGDGLWRAFDITRTAISSDRHFRYRRGHSGAGLAPGRVNHTNSSGRGR
jgi:hypothetical protein